MKSEIEDPSMSYAENGVIVSYCEKSEKATKGTYDNCMREYKKEVFNDLEVAFARFKELFKMTKAHEKYEESQKAKSL